MNNQDEYSTFFMVLFFNFATLIIVPLKACMRLGIDLDSSLARITAWAEPSDDEGESENNGSSDVTQIKQPSAHSRDFLVEVCQSAIQIEGRGERERKRKKDKHCFDCDQEKAIFWQENELILMLQKPPRDVPQLKTKVAFKSFFAGMERSKMEYLLYAANKELGIRDMEKKVMKRMDLLKDVLK